MHLVASVGSGLRHADMLTSTFVMRASYRSDPISVSVGLRIGQPTSFIDEYAASYRGLFSDVRSFDHFTRLNVGLLSDVAGKSLPAIGRVSGAEPQALHHFIANAAWDVTQVHKRISRLDTSLPRLAMPTSFI